MHFYPNLVMRLDLAKQMFCRNETSKAVKNVCILACLLVWFHHFERNILAFAYLG